MAGAAAKNDGQQVMLILSPDDFKRLVGEAVRAELRRGNPANDQLMTTEQAANYCGMSPTALQKHIERGALVPDVWGQRGRTNGHRFRRDTLDAFLRISKE